jgi:hypothetical protein
MKDYVKDDQRGIALGQRVDETVYCAIELAFGVMICYLLVSSKALLHERARTCELDKRTNRFGQTVYQWPGRRSTGRR